MLILAGWMDFSPSNEFTLIKHSWKTTLSPDQKAILSEPLVTCNQHVMAAPDNRLCAVVVVVWPNCYYPIHSITSSTIHTLGLNVPHWCGWPSERIQSSNGHGNQAHALQLDCANSCDTLGYRWQLPGPYGWMSCGLGIRVNKQECNHRASHTIGYCFGFCCNLFKQNVPLTKMMAGTDVVEPGKG